MFFNKSALSALERDGQLISKSDINSDSIELPDKIIDTDLKKGKLQNYFTPEAWNYLLHKGIMTH